MNTIQPTPVEPHNVIRYPNNPIIRKEDVKPSFAGWQVDYVTNAACQRVGNEVLLLLRVAESPVVGPDRAGSMYRILFFRRSRAGVLPDFGSQRS